MEELKEFVKKTSELRNTQYAWKLSCFLFKFGDQSIKLGWVKRLQPKWKGTHPDYHTHSKFHFHTNHFLSMVSGPHRVKANYPSRLELMTQLYRGNVETAPKWPWKQSSDFTRVNKHIPSLMWLLFSQEVFRDRTSPTQVSRIFISVIDSTWVENKWRQEERKGKKEQHSNEQWDNRMQQHVRNLQTGQKAIRLKEFQEFYKFMGKTFKWYCSIHISICNFGNTKHNGGVSVKLQILSFLSPTT